MDSGDNIYANLPHRPPPAPPEKPLPPTRERHPRLQQQPRGISLTSSAESPAPQLPPVPSPRKPSSGNVLPTPPKPCPRLPTNKDPQLSPMPGHRVPTGNGSPQLPPAPISRAQAAVGGGESRNGGSTPPPVLIKANIASRPPQPPPAHAGLNNSSSLSSSPKASSSLGLRSPPGHLASSPPAPVPSPSASSSSSSAGTVSGHFRTPSESSTGSGSGGVAVSGSNGGGGGSFLSAQPTASALAASLYNMGPLPVVSNVSAVKPLDEPTVAGSVQRLQQGIVVTVYSLKRKPERMNLMVQPNLYLLQCVRRVNDKPEITVDLYRVQELRCGRRCFDFEKWPEDANREDIALCLTIFYGVETVPQTLSVAARNPDDFFVLLTALKHLVDASHSLTYQGNRQRWFRQQFYSILGTAPGRKNDEKISIKQLRGWLLRNSLKVSKKIILPILTQLCLGDSLRYGGFMSVVTELMQIFSVKKQLQSYVVEKDGVKCVTQATFLKFLKQEQNETSSTEADAKVLMDQYLEGSSSRMTSYTHMDLTQFEDFLFSPFNSVWRPDCNSVHQDMTQPLSHYWIASSHNTYLVGRQITGQSSVEMYARCLRMGCRCLELDCWNGGEDGPIITHGRTLVSKIKVVDVLKVIKENAWITSDYPVILSIENHLNLPQQRYLAKLFQDIFGSELLTEPVDHKEQQMPSPEQLKRKIIIKDKKLNTAVPDSEDVPSGKNTVKTITLKMNDLECKGWHPVTFGLTDTSLYFTNDRKDEDDDDAEEDIDYDEYFNEYDSEEDEDELDYQPWYYDDLQRQDVKRLLKGTNSSIKRQQGPHGHHGNHGQGGHGGQGAKYKPEQDGVFLVRNSDRAGYTLSFIWEGEAKHLRVRTREDDAGRTLYTFDNEVWRPTIVELIKYFRNHRLCIFKENIRLYLDKPLCKPYEDLEEDWYRPNMNRYMAERLLLRIHQEGAFLVRGSSEPGCLSLSFRHKHKISHFQIAKRGKAYVCGSYRFFSLPKMVEYFRRRPLYRKTKLTVAATDDIAGCMEDEECCLYEEVVYNDPADMTQCKKVTVRALYDFFGHKSQNEMTFTRGAIITNIKEEDKPWWKGDYMNQKQKSFPANYVEVIRGKDESDPDRSENEAVKSLEDTLDLKDCKLDSGPYMENKGSLFCFRLEHPRYKQPLLFGCESQLQLGDCVAAIKEAQSRLDVLQQEQQRQEKNQKRARELSDLVVYCQSVGYDPNGTRRHYNVSSLVEDKVHFNDNSLLRNSRVQLLRVYPKATRVKSSNYDPLTKWACGVQLAALNYQTPDLQMQLNQARFITNGGCGYVLKPPFMRETKYSLDDVINLKVPSDVLFLTVTVMAGRNLCSEGRVMGTVRPFVVVEILDGLPLDKGKLRTSAVDEDNGLNPEWNADPMQFDVSCPELAFLRFEVLNEVNDSKNTIAQATFPVKGLRQGYRSVPLKNCHSEPLDMSSLLVHIEMKGPKDAEEESLFRVLEGLRRMRAELLSSDNDSDDERSFKLYDTEQRILRHLQARRTSEQL